MAIIDDIYDKSDEFIGRWENRIKLAIANYLFDRLEVSENRITANSGNWVVLNGLDSVAGDEEVQQFIADNLTDILQDTVGRYDQYGADGADLVETFLGRYAQDQANEKVLSKYYTQVRNKTLQMIVEGKTLEQVKAYVNTTNIGYKQFAENTYARYQRSASDVLRKRAGLRYAVYEGGTIKNTRQFCLDRDGKVFSSEEIEAWSGLDWEGKSTPYNPFTDCGGYNCRHRLNWISDELAEFMRGENE